MNYIIDNCSLTNLANCGLLSVCLTLLEHAFYVTPTVCDIECTTCKTEVDSLIINGCLSKLEFTPDLPDFIRLTNQYKIDAGECESILACQLHEFAFISDDKAARDCAASILGENNKTGSLGLIRQLVANNSITCEDAINAYHSIKIAGGFMPRINPKAELC